MTTAESEARNESAGLPEREKEYIEILLDAIVLADYHYRMSKWPEDYQKEHESLEAAKQWLEAMLRKPAADRSLSIAKPVATDASISTCRSSCR